MKAIFQLFFCFAFSCGGLYAQVPGEVKSKKNDYQKNLCLLTGFGQGKFSYLNIGLALLKNGRDGHHSFTTAVAFSNEIKLSSKIIVGPKISVWAAGGLGALALGMSIIYYTDFDGGSLVFRPEAGLGVNNIKIVYGYNESFTKNSFEGVNKSQVALVYCFKLKKLNDVTGAKL